MRTSQAGRPGPSGLASRLLIALALCACGGGGDDAGGAPAGDTAAAPSAQTALAAADTCTGPPPAYGQTVLTGSWQALLDSLAADSVTFPDIPGNDDTARVALCRTCDTVAVEIRSGNMTPCMSPGDLTGPGQRITGMFIVRDTFPAQRGWDTLYPGDTLFAFTNSIAGPATLVYNQNGSGKPSPATAWRFWYCTDGHNADTAQAQWRPRGNPPPRGPGDDDEVGEGDGSYGWMACASGCCQFYTPPPNENSTQTTPEQADPNAPDTVGAGQGGRDRKPYWCKTR